MEKEKILVVPRPSLGEIPQKGFRPVEPSYLDSLRPHFTFVDREPAETDPSLKQLIPYMVVFDHAGRVFVFRRLHGGGEKRLENLRSIGIGGHVRPSDGSDPVMGGALRELREELTIRPERRWSLSFMGILNDDTNDVGSVHLGLVFTLRLPEGVFVEVGEPDVLAGSFMERSDAAGLDGYETWSQILIPHLEELWARSS